MKQAEAILIAQAESYETNERIATQEGRADDAEHARSIAQECREAAAHLRAVAS